MQSTILVVTAILMAVVVSVFVFVVLNAGKEAVEFPQVQKKAYAIRAKFFYVMLLAGVVITAITTLDLPYAATRGELADVTKTLDVSGSQWSWQVSDEEIEAGDTVVFNVTASDVNHGLGIYNDELRMVGQTQAMPGYTNALKLTFEEPGTYKLMCMEYCGLAHHAMVSEIEVKAK